MPESNLDVLIFGGGVAGLWLLDELRRAGVSSALLETQALGEGQTIAAQGILHSGLKYTLDGQLSASARAAREMPAIWRQCLAGQAEPNLQSVRLRAGHCHLWRTDSLRSRLGMFGARLGLFVTPAVIAKRDRPHVLQSCPGAVAQLDEQVLSPASLVSVLAERNRGHILHIQPRCEIRRAYARQWHVDVKSPAAHEGHLHARVLVFAAGAGNAKLRGQIGLKTSAMQRRPLHMVVVRGNLPELNGHCVDGARTRVTITSDCDERGCRVWQIGGQIAEIGVEHQPAQLIRLAQQEILAVLPGIDLRGTEWATQRVDRAEEATADGSRPHAISVLSDANVLTAWPTKLVLAPQLAAAVREQLAELGIARAEDEESALPAEPVEFADWPRPPVAAYPWDKPIEWLPYAPQLLRKAA